MIFNFFKSDKCRQRVIRFNSKKSNNYLQLQLTREEIQQKKCTVYHKVYILIFENKTEYLITHF